MSLEYWSDEISGVGGTIILLKWNKLTSKWRSRLNNWKWLLFAFFWSEILHICLICTLVHFDFETRGKKLFKKLCCVMFSPRHASCIRNLRFYKNFHNHTSPFNRRILSNGPRSPRSSAQHGVVPMVHEKRIMWTWHQPCTWASTPPPLHQYLCIMQSSPTYSVQ